MAYWFSRMAAPGLLDLMGPSDTDSGEEDGPWLPQRGVTRQALARAFFTHSATAVPPSFS